MALLADGLVDRGHDVTLIAAGEPGTKAITLPTFEEPQGHRLGRPEPELLHAARVAGLLADLPPDVVHDHSAVGPAFARDRSWPTVVTSHGPATGDWGEYLAAARPGDVPRRHLAGPGRPDARAALVGGGAQRPGRLGHPLPAGQGATTWSGWAGCPRTRRPTWRSTSPARPGAGSCSPASAASRTRRSTSTRGAAPARRRRGVPRRGRPGREVRLLGGAAGFLFPLQWEEPFGMVLIEAMACGTPVLWLARGAVPEVVVDGETGFVRREADDLVGPGRPAGRDRPRRRAGRTWSGTSGPSRWSTATRRRTATAWRARPARRDTTGSPRGARQRLAALRTFARMSAGDAHRRPVGGAATRRPRCARRGTSHRPRHRAAASASSASSPASSVG